MEKIQVNVVPNEKGEQVIYLVHRTGEAEKIEVKNAVSLSGSIDSVIDFETKRREKIQALESHLIMDETKMEILFIVNEADRVRHTISGTLVEHPYIKELGLNGDKEYTLNELLKVLKLNRRFFATRSEHAAIVSSIMNFNPKTEIEFEDKNSLKGAVSYKRVEKLTHEMPLAFEMEIPIFIGEPPVKFNVDVEVVPDNGTLVCKLVSVELMEMKESILRSKWEKVKTHFANYVIINK